MSNYQMALCKDHLPPSYALQLQSSTRCYPDQADSLQCNYSNDYLAPKKSSTTKKSRHSKLEVAPNIYQEFSLAQYEFGNSTPISSSKKPVLPSTSRKECSSKKQRQSRHGLQKPVASRNPKKAITKDVTN